MIAQSGMQRKRGRYIERERERNALRGIIWLLYGNFMYLAFVWPFSHRRNVRARVHTSNIHSLPLKLVHFYNAISIERDEPSNNNNNNNRKVKKKAEPLFTKFHLHQLLCKYEIYTKLIAFVAFGSICQFIGKFLVRAIDVENWWWHQ